MKRRPSNNSEWNERFAKRLPHIFIGIVVNNDVSLEAYKSHCAWFMQAGARLQGKFRISFGTSNGRQEQYRARNGLLTQATVEGADFLLMIDDDQTLHQCPDMIEKFWELGQPVAGGLYYHKGGLYHPVVMKEYVGAGGKRKFRYLHPKEIGEDPMPVDVLGGGCHFLDIKVFDLIKEPHHWPYPHENCFVPDENVGLDVHFCMKMREHGIQPWLHPGIKLGHVSHARMVVDETTRPSQEVIEQDPEYALYWRNVYGEGMGNERARKSA